MNRNLMAFLGVIGSIFILYSCKEDASWDEKGEKQEIILKVEIDVPSQTRATTDLEFKTSFEDGDEIGVYAVIRTSSTVQEYPNVDITKNFLNNVKFVYSAEFDQWICTEGPYYYPIDKTPVDFYAYYPYSGNSSTRPDNVMTYRVSPEGKDLMTARTPNATKSYVPLTLTFSHKLALVQVNVPDADLYRTINVRMNNITASARLDMTKQFQDSELTNISYVTDVMMSEVEHGVFRLLIPSQSITKNDNLFYVEANSTTYEINNPVAIYLTAGRAYSMDATLVRSEEDVPNSYIIKPGSYIDIPVSKAYTAWRDIAALSSEDYDMSAEPTAQILWQEKQNLITNLWLRGSHADAVIRVSTSSLEGNAVIGVSVDGKIRWSWHIWVTNYDPKLSYIVYEDGGKEYHFMDRNLGAVTTSTADKGAYGLMYQWGRKDPFPGAAVAYSSSTTNHNTVYTASGSAITFPSVESVSASNNLPNSIYNPTTFYHSDMTSDWYTNSQSGMNSLLWNNTDGSKSIFDPCPGGWRIPVSENKTSPWEGVTSYASSWINYGRRIIAKNDFWPAAGKWNKSSNLEQVGTGGYYWSANPMHASSENVAGAAVLKFTSVALPAVSGESRSAGFPVRCVKDLSNN